MRQKQEMQMQLSGLENNLKRLKVEHNVSCFACLCDWVLTVTLFLRFCCYRCPTFIDSSVVRSEHEQPLFRGSLGQHVFDLRAHYGNK